MSSKKSILIKQIQQLQGIEGVELIMVEPCEDNYMLCHIYFDPESVVDRLTPEDVALRNYNATVKRGLINSETTKQDFIDKMKEEISELELALLNNDKFNENEELSDISHVCDAYALNYGIDLQKEKELKMYVNETRLD